MDETENNRLADLLIELAKGNHRVLSDIALMMQKILYSIGFIYYKNQRRHGRFHSRIIRNVI